MTCALTPQERQKYQKLLDQAEAAYHAAMTGGGIRAIKDQNGEAVEYSSANVTRLLAYINTLRGYLGLPTFGACVGATKPLTFIF